jgi:hypothetical protein
VKLETRRIPNGILVFAGERCLAGIGHHWYRPWLYPLYTPAGHPVLQEFPFDHPFHNGCFIAQNPVRSRGKEANFWAVPPKREPNDEVFVNVGRVDVLSLEEKSGTDDDSLMIEMRCTWRGPEDEPVVEEVRNFVVSCGETTTTCEVRSRKTAAYGEVEFPATKFGGIAVRVDPQLLPVAGARIVGKHAAASRFVAYENARFGLALVAEPSLPWFVRDYGLAVYNPTWKTGRTLAKGETWETRLTLVAYDGARPSSI